MTPDAPTKTMQSAAARTVPWRRVRLGAVCRVIGGSTPKSGVSEYWDGDIVWITPSDLGQLKGKLITDSNRKITQAGYRSCGTELVPAGSVVLSSRAPIGYLGVAGRQLCTNQGCKTFIPGPEVVSDFLYYSLMFRVSDLQAAGSGATFAEVSKGVLEAFEIDLPTVDEQKRLSALINEKLQEYAVLTQQLAEQLDWSRRLPAALLRQVFNGHQITGRANI